MPGVYGKIQLLISEYVLEGNVSLGNFSKNKRDGGCPFFPLPPSLHAGAEPRVSWSWGAPSPSISGTIVIACQPCWL